MTITLTGENSFSLGRELHRVVNSYEREYGELGVEQLDGEEAELSRIQEALTSLPFLADRKLVVLRRPSANKLFVDAAEKLLGEAPETTTVIIVEPKLDKRLAYYKFLKKSTDFREFLPLEPRELATWIGREAKQYGGTISAADARYLVERVGANQQLLANELDKVLLHSPDITRATIDLLTEATPQSTIFQLLEAAFAGDGRATLKLYAEQRAQKVEPPQIIAMLAWQLHVLALIKTAGERSPAQIASEAKLSPFVLQKSQNIARKLSLPELKQLIADLLAIDTRSKRENLDPDEALQNYLLNLTQ